MEKPAIYFSLLFAAIAAFALIGIPIGLIARRQRWTLKTARLVSQLVPSALGLAIQITAVLTKEAAVKAKLPVPEWTSLPWILWLPASFLTIWLCGRIAFPGQDFVTPTKTEENPLSIR